MSYDVFRSSGADGSARELRCPPQCRLPWTVFVLCILTLVIGVVMPVILGVAGVGVTMLALVVVAVMARGWSPNDGPWFITLPRFRVGA